MLIEKYKNYSYEIMDLEVNENYFFNVSGVMLS